MLSSGLSGFVIAFNQGVGAIIVGVINILAMVFQALALYKVYNLVPKLAKKPAHTETSESNINLKIKQKLKVFVDGWILLFQSKMVIPGIYFLLNFEFFLIVKFAK